MSSKADPLLDGRLTLTRIHPQGSAHPIMDYHKGQVNPDLMRIKAAEDSYFRRIKARICHGMPPVQSILTVLLLLAVSVVVAENCTSGLPPIIHAGPPPNRPYNVAEPIKLVCRAHGSHPIRFTWYKDGRRLGGNESYQVVNGSLKIRKASAYSEGHYQCYASNDCGTAMSNITHLQRMYVSPARSGPSKMRYRNGSVGNKVTIQCDKMEGTAKVSFYWHKMTKDTCKGRGRRVSEDVRISMDMNGSLAFSNLLASDEGVYKCFALGANGRHGAGCVKLTVEPNPHKQNLVPQLMYHSRSPQYGFQGEDFHLKCFFAGSPTPRVTFKKDGQSLPRGRYSIDDVRHQLTIKDAAIEDSGYYICQGQNEAGESEQVRIHVNIFARPELIQRPVSINASQGARAMFKCKGQGYPTPQVTWFKNTQPLTEKTLSSSSVVSPDGSELTISAVRLDDRGTYHCNVSNDYGYVLAAAYLNVDDDFVENAIHVIEERKGENEEQDPGGEKFTTSSVGYVIGAIVVAIILTVIVVLLVRSKKKSDSYNLGSPESYRLDNLGSDHAVGHRLLEEPQHTVTQV